MKAHIFRTQMRCISLSSPMYLHRIQPNCKIYTGLQRVALERASLCCATLLGRSHSTECKNTTERKRERERVRRRRWHKKKGNRELHQKSQQPPASNTIHFFKRLLFPCRFIFVHIPTQYTRHKYNKHNSKCIYVCRWFSI